MKRFIVLSLLTVCNWTHWLTRRLPVRTCPFASWADVLDQRWGTGVWQPPPREEETA